VPSLPPVEFVPLPTENNFHDHDEFLNR